MSLSINTNISAAALSLARENTANLATVEASLSSASTVSVNSAHMRLNSNQVENLTAALENIQSADFAEEASNYVQQSIILKAAASIATQSNLDRDSALHLLK